MPERRQRINGNIQTSAMRVGERIWKGVTFRGLSEDGDITDPVFGADGADGAHSLDSFNSEESEKLGESSKCAPSAPSAPDSDDSSQAYHKRLFGNPPQLPLPQNS